MSLDYDTFEGLMAGTMQSLVAIYRAEVSLKEYLCRYFNVTIEFEYEYKDMQVVFPSKLKEFHPILSVLDEYEWFSFSNNVDHIIFFNRKSTMPFMNQEGIKC